ncbi:hypothetical protein ACJRO7_024874 [Eucalyptus globulus]|uniref:D-isomer specific 2-hydroxyacid dehydrogenase catalytic domain-containing protein n=1 Tax=Eucalyptus globulus TaxID=34317 RepID=A0ABD3K6Y6_EUCGL
MAAVSSWNLVFTRPSKQRSLSSSSSSSLSWARSLPSFPSKSHLRFASGASRAASPTVLSLLDGKPTVLVTEKLGQAGLDLLKAFANVDCSYNLSPEELSTKISLCDALIVRSSTRVTREVFKSSGGQLKVAGRAGVGIDNVDVLAATKHGASWSMRPRQTPLPSRSTGLPCSLQWRGTSPRQMLR